jgi:hypothetical protein
MGETRVPVNSGKYTFIVQEDGSVRCARYGDNGWVFYDKGAKALIALVSEHAAALARVTELETILAETKDSLTGTQNQRNAYYTKIRELEARALAAEASTLSKYEAAVVVCALHVAAETERGCNDDRRIERLASAMEAAAERLRACYALPRRACTVAALVSAPSVDSSPEELRAAEDAETTNRDYTFAEELLREFGGGREPYHRNVRPLALRLAAHRSTPRFVDAPSPALLEAMVGWLLVDAGFCKSQDEEAAAFVQRFGPNGDMNEPPAKLDPKPAVRDNEALRALQRAYKQ